MVKIKNVYWMLAYAFDILKYKGTQNIKTEEFDNIYNLLSTILINSLNYQIKKGLKKEYICQTDTLSGIKGKILISDSIKNNTLKKHQLICECDEFSVNTYLNKIVKTTLIKLSHNKNVDETCKKKIKKILIYLKDVQEIPINNIAWKALKYNKNNVSYKVTINVCYLVIEGLLLSEERGEPKLAEFIGETRMSTLYERFVKEYYKKHFPCLNARARHISWNIGKDESIGLLPDMKTDITLTYKEKELIIDTKYYGKTLQYNTLFNKQTIINANINQVFAYVKNEDLNNTGNVSGMLLYAKTDEEMYPNQTNTFGKNIITIRTLDLTQDFNVVMEQLDNIAYEFTNNEVRKKEI